MAHENGRNISSLDPALGAPLPAGVARYGNLADEIGDDDPLTVAIRPLLYRMYVSAQILRLGTEARYSALVFLHRYVCAIHRRTGTQERPSQWVAAACLFLATKSEEEPRRLRDMVNLSQMILDPKVDQLCDATVINLDIAPPLLDEAYWETKKKLVESEQAVLRWLGFDTLVPHPHRAVALLLRHLPWQQQHHLAEIAARRLNDGLFYGPALQHDVLELACAAIELGLPEVEEGEKVLVQGWWKKYGVTDEKLQLSMRDLRTATNVLERCKGDEALTT